MTSFQKILVQGVPLSSEAAQAVKPIEMYFLGHAEDDASHMRQAFLPSAHIESVKDGVFTSWPLDMYCQRFKGQPAQDESTRSRTLDWVEVKGNAACARVTLVHGPTVFTDYFVLLQIAGEWKIANKVFDY